MPYTITNQANIDELNCTLTELTHDQCGAQIMHIGNDDQENLFNISFRTCPTSSDGIAHILEHTVLCGSDKFPTRDPFFSMTRRSLNTFMNALTGADFTCYPAASQIETDFYNLLDVYLDAVFFPQLTKMSFLQEGHRLEFKTPDDPTSELEYKGIVYNEMKGALATGDARLGEKMMQALYPDITYGVNSGGEPHEIPNLTHKALKAFHSKYYDPSRALFFFYGNLPLQGHLDYLEKRIFSGAKKKRPLPPIPKQPRFEKPRSFSGVYPLSDDPKDKTLIAYGWLTCSILDQVELLALNVIDIVLMGTDASALKMALIQSNLCQQVDSFMDNEMSEIPYFITCKGCALGVENQLKELIFKTLQTATFPKHLVEGAIGQLELARTEITGNSSPFGLSLFFRAALLKQHGGRAEDGLRVHTLFSELQKRVADPSYLPSLVKKFFLDNPHFVQVSLNPDNQLNAKEIEDEKSALQDIRDQLDARGIKKVLKESSELMKQQEENDVESLPKISLDDVPQQGVEYALTKESFGPLTLYHHDQFTNDVIYADLVYDLPHIAEDKLAFLRLFVLILPQMGCGARDYKENLDYILEHIGGVSLSLDLTPHVSDPNQVTPSISIRGKSLTRKSPELFCLLKDLITSADLTDKERISELLMQHFYGLENSIQTNSLKYAISLASSGLSIPSKISNALYGLEYYDQLKLIMKMEIEDVIEELMKMQKLCLGLEGGDLVLTCDRASFAKLKESHFHGLDAIASHPSPPFSQSFALEKVVSQGRITASPVAFTALVFPTSNYLDPEMPALSVASEIMENLVLHKRIREQGGAYGAGASNNILHGQFYLYSYRDPHLTSTKEAFVEAAKCLAEGNFEALHIEEAKLGLFQELDSPIAPGSRGYTAYSRLRSGRTPEVRACYRKRLLTLGKKEIVFAAQKYLLPGIENGTLIAFASEEFFAKETYQPPLYPI